MVTTAEGVCGGCGRRTMLAPLHGPEKGGPLRCFVCAGAWHAEHGLKRRTGRVAIRALAAFMDAGGSMDDVGKLKMTALAKDMGFLGEEVLDPLGYMAETVQTAKETILLTSELLVEALRLTHPDVHPPERRDLANRVTQQLLELQPFTFPAVVRPPPPPPPPRNASTAGPQAHYQKDVTPRYPCADCASGPPMFYCTACLAEYDRRHRIELDRASAKRRKHRKFKRSIRVQPKPCSCGKRIVGKRKDAKFCSNACRQKAHRAASTPLEAAQAAQRTPF